jgi:hypothetical protein
MSLNRGDLIQQVADGREHREVADDDLLIVALAIRPRARVPP